MKNIAKGGWPWFALERYWEQGKEDLETLWSFAAGDIDLDALRRDEYGNSIPYLGEYRKSIMEIMSGMTEEERADWILRMIGPKTYRRNYGNKIT